MKNLIIFLLVSIPSFVYAQQAELGINLGHTAAIQSVRFSTDGKYLTSSAQDGTIKIWDVNSGKLLKTSPNANNTFRGCLYFFPELNQVTFSTESLMNSESLKHWTWDLNSNTMEDTRVFEQRVISPTLTLPNQGPDNGKILRNLMEPFDFTNGFGNEHKGFYPRTNSYYNRTGDQLIFYKEFNENQPGNPLTYSGLTESFSFGGNDLFILGSPEGPAGQNFTIWNAYSAEIHAQVSLPEKTYLNDISPDGKYLLLTDDSGQTSLYDLSLQRILPPLQGGIQTSLSPLEGNKSRLSLDQASFSPDGKMVARGGQSGEIYLHDLASGRLKTVLKGYTQAVRYIQFENNGQSIESIKADNKLHSWQLTSGLVQVSPENNRPKLETADGEVLGLSEDKTMAVIRDNNGQVVLWDIKDNKSIKNIMDDSNQRTRFAKLSNDKKKVVLVQSLYTMNKNSTDILWDIEQGKEIRTFQRPGIGVTNGATFSPDDKHLLVGNEDGSIFYYEVNTGTLIHSFDNTHENNISDLAFSPDGTKFISSSTSKTGEVKIWDLKSKKNLATIISLDENGWVVIGENGLFDASQEAMNLLFYKINYDGQTELVELEQLKARYYEPGLLQKLMGFSNERIRSVEGLQQVALYPQVTANIQNDQLEVSLQARNGGIGQVSIFANGKEIVNDGNPQRSTSLSYNLRQAHNFLFRHPDSVNIISLRAYNQAGWLKSSSIDLVYEPTAWTRGNSQSGNSGWTGKLDPKMYVVTIGTSDYSGSQLDLKYATQDATIMAKAMQSVGGNLFNNGDSIEVYCLTTASAEATGLEGTKVNWQFASKENVQSTLSIIKQKAKAEDVLMVYLSGHGITHGPTDKSQFYYLTHSMASEEMISDEDVRKKYSISSGELTEWINQIPALKQVLIVDACNSGKVVENLTSNTRNLNSSQIRALDRMKDRTGMFILSGSAADKVSYEASEYGQGLLTYSLLQGMKGVATRRTADGDYVDVMKLFQHARDEVPRLASTINGIQTPMLGFPTKGASFDIGIFNNTTNIPLASRKPVIIRSLFMNQDKLQDDLNLVELIETAFREETEEGSDGNFIYVDVNNYPGAYSLGGLYTKDGDNIKITVKLFKGGQNPVELTIRPTDDPKRLARYIVREVKKVLRE